MNIDLFIYSFYMFFLCEKLNKFFHSFSTSSIHDIFNLIIMDFSIFQNPSINSTDVMLYIT